MTAMLSHQGIEGIHFLLSEKAPQNVGTRKEKRLSCLVFLQSAGSCRLGRQVRES
jgi:hypothetical protein